MTIPIELPDDSPAPPWVGGEALPAWVIAAQADCAVHPPIVKAERCHCGAPACWEVEFADDPHSEYFCAAHPDPDYIADPIAWPAGVCSLCEGAHTTQRCPSVLAPLFAPAVLDRIFERGMDRLAHPHPCSSCGDLTAADICAACQQDQLIDMVAA